MAQKLQNTYEIVSTVVVWESFRHNTSLNSKQNYFIVDKQRKLVLPCAFTSDTRHT